MRVIIIVQARMNSSRLPGKVLRVIDNKSILEILVNRLRQVESAHEIVIATTDHINDDLIVQECERLNVKWFRGSESDVLSRYYEAATTYQGDVIVRVTSDCPLIDPNVINNIIKLHMKETCDYTSNVLLRTFPRGMDTEVFSYEVLREAHRKASLEIEREHVTPYIYTRPEQFQLQDYCYPDDVSSYRWTVDTYEDLQVVQLLYEAISPKFPNFTLEQLLHLIQLHPEWSLINQAIEQKKLGE